MTSPFMARPCADCPFRRVGAIDLRPGRVEQIVRDLLADDWSSFVCHETLHKKRKQCAGSMVVLLKADRPSVVMRLAASQGMLDFDKLRELYPEIIEVPPRCAR